MSKSFGFKKPQEAAEVALSPASSSSSLMSKIRTRSTSSPVASAPPSLKDNVSLDDAAPAAPRAAAPAGDGGAPPSATTTGGGLGLLLGIKRRGPLSAGSASTANSPSGGSPSASVVGGAGGKVLQHSQSFTGSFGSQRSPSVNTSTSVNSATGGRRELPPPTTIVLPVTFAEFRKNDVNPRRQRAALSLLQRHESRLRQRSRNSRKSFK
ncbi:hypothetical protein HK405_012463, partial [Cladochytrium tenue]